VFTVRVYPNPVSTTLYVDLPQGKTGVLEIYSSTGNPVLRQAPLGTAQSMDVSGLLQGHYVVRITTCKHTAVVKNYQMAGLVSEQILIDFALSGFLFS
jgi:hypothetical protein